MSRVKHTTKTSIMPTHQSVRTMVYFSLSVLAVMMSTYVYFVGKVVFDVVARKSAENSIRASSSEVAAMQTQYFSQIRSLDLAQAQNFGLIKSANVQYASRDTSGAATVGLLIH